MGLSFHYSGRFNQNASLPEMIEEVKDIAEVFKWKYHIFNQQLPANASENEYDGELYGILFSPERCEPVCLTFLSNGRMSGPANLYSFGDTSVEEEKEYLYMLSTKTQYAGQEVHKAIIQLLRYVSKKYLKDFELIDEGQFWETGDEEILRANFERNWVCLNAIGNALDNLPSQPGEDTESLVERLIRHLQQKGR